MDWSRKTRATITFHALYDLNEQEIIPLLASFELKRRSLEKLLRSTYFTKQDPSRSILHHVFDIYGCYGSPWFSRNRLEHANVVELLQGQNKVQVSSTVQIINHFSVCLSSYHSTYKCRAVVARIWVWIL